MALRARISGCCSASSRRTETWTGSCTSSFLKTAMASMADSTNWLVCTMRVASRLMMPVNSLKQTTIATGSVWKIPMRMVYAIHWRLRDAPIWKRTISIRWRQMTTVRAIITLIRALRTPSRRTSRSCRQIPLCSATNPCLR